MGEGAVEDVGVEVRAGLKAERVGGGPTACGRVVVATTEADPAGKGFLTLGRKAPGREASAHKFAISSVAPRTSKVAIEGNEADDAPLVVMERGIGDVV